jgi:hypothetical protein
MSKRNSKEAKQQRRKNYEEKQSRFSNPCPHPEKDYLRHFGYVPNEPFFHNAAVAACDSKMKVAMRTKEQLIDYVENHDLKPMGTRSGKGIFHISLFKTADYKITKSDGEQWYVSEKPQSKVEKSYYIIRENIGRIHGQEFDENEWKRENPFYEQLNTFMVPAENIKNLPDLAPTDEELIAIGKEDEAVQPLNEMELDQLLSQSKEYALRENYMFNDDGLIIDEFKGEGGETYYQPRKKDKSWLHCVFSTPFIIKDGELGVCNLRDTMQTKYMNTDILN